MLKSSLFLTLSIFLLLGASVYAQEEYVYDSQGKRDPFISLVTGEGRFLQMDSESESKKAQDLFLEGIVFDKYGLSYAMINGLVVRIGDQVEDYQVLKIEEKKIILIKDGQIREIELKEE